MAAPSATQLRTLLQRLVDGYPTPDFDALFEDPGLDLLPLLQEPLQSDLPIQTLELLESLLKAALLGASRRGASGDEARTIARFQHDVGFLMKYKSYAIKAASPLGYSVFVQNPGEGFSFQTHVTHKIEVFHILQPLDRAYAFLCSFRDWEATYDAAAFQHWLAGRNNPDYDRFTYQLQSGDVLVMDSLNVAHTVVGCILEEFATTSTDMVERLFDQNAGKTVPAHLNRRTALQALRNLPAHTEFLVRDRPGSTRSGATVTPREIPGGQQFDLFSNAALEAAHLLLEPRACSAVLHHATRWASVCVIAGSGSLLLGTPDEVARQAPQPIGLQPGDLVMVPSGAAYQFESGPGSPLHLSRQTISPQLAFATP